MENNGKMLETELEPEDGEQWQDAGDGTGARGWRMTRRWSRTS